MLDSERLAGLVSDLDKVINTEIPEYVEQMSRLKMVSAQRDAIMMKAEIDAYLLTDWSEEDDDDG